MMASAAASVSQPPSGKVAVGINRHQLRAQHPGPPIAPCAGCDHNPNEKQLLPLPSRYSFEKIDTKKLKSGAQIKNQHFGIRGLARCNVSSCRPAGRVTAFQRRAVDHHLRPAPGAHRPCAGGPAPGVAVCARAIKTAVHAGIGMNQHRVLGTIGDATRRNTPCFCSVGTVFCS
jgi:hypothetical protein